MSNKARKDWNRVALSELISSLDAGVSVNSEGRSAGPQEIGVLKTSCVNRGRFNPAEHKAVLNGERHRVRVPVRADSIIISRMNTPDLVGESAYIEEDHPNLFLPDRLWLLKTNLRVNSRWLSYYMQSEFFRTQIDDIATGTSGSMKNISKGRLAGLSILLPSVEEQRRIAEVLLSIDRAIAANSEALGQVERSRSAILHAAFEGNNWEAVPLGELGKWRSGSTPAKEISANWGGGIPWVCPRDMKVPIVTKTQDTISSVATMGGNKLASSGTLLLVVRGMILARAIPTAILGVDAAYNQDIKAFIPNGRASPRFIQMCIQHQEASLLRVVNTATHGTKKLDSDIIEAIPIPLPDPEAQKVLVTTVSRLDQATVYYGAEHLRLSELRRGIRADLLSGRVRVPK